MNVFPYRTKSGNLGWGGRSRRALALTLLYTFTFSLMPFQVFAETPRSEPHRLGLPQPVEAVAVAEQEGPALEAAPEKAALEETAQPVENPRPLRILSRVEKRLTPLEGGLLELGRVSLEVPPGALKEETLISLEELGEVEELGESLSNATAQAAGYRALPHGTQFQLPVTLSVPYDPLSADTPGKREDLFTYFYDEELQHWIKLERLRIDTERQTVVSLTTHFTDFINGTLKLPESPKPLGFNPNSIKDIKAADPSAGYAKLEGFEASTQGGASFQVPLKLPAGRLGVQPSLALSYSSQGGSGLLGHGFDLSLPSVTIDTRFGVPRFTGEDRYLLNGQLLVEKERTGGKVYYVPQTETGSFSRIWREAGATHQYTWYVQDKSGALQVYGEDLGSTLGKDTSHDYQWKLSRVQDVRGNWVKYSYSLDQGFLYPEAITYTGFTHPGTGVTTEGLYRVEFVWEDRDDRRFEARGGFVSKTAQRLKQVRVMSQGTAFRVYDFQYTYDVFGKSLLKGYSEGDGSQILYRYGFEYYEAEEDGQDKILGFTDMAVWPNPAMKLDGSLSTSTSLGGSFSGGAKLLGQKLFEVGVNASVNSTRTYETAKMMDLDGDGLPDFYKHFNTSRKFYKGTGGSEGFVEKPGALPAEFWSAVDRPQSSQSQASFGVFGSGVGLSASATFSSDKTHSPWTYGDMNGDGLIDIIESGGTYWENVSYGNSVAFTPKTFGTQLETIEPQGHQLIDQFHLLDPLRVWAAPYPGEVKIYSRLASAEPPSPWDGVQRWVYHNSQALGDPQSLNSQSGNEIVFEQTNLALLAGDRLVFRTGGVKEIEGDTLSEETRIEYQKVSPFAHLSRQVSALLPASIDTSHYSGDELEVLSAVYDTVNPTYGQAELRGYSSQEDQDLALDLLWSLEDTVWIPARLTPEEYLRAQYQLITTQTSEDSYLTEWKDVLYGYYTYDFSRNEMVLKSYRGTTLSDQGALRPYLAREGEYNYLTPSRLQKLPGPLAATSRYVPSRSRVESSQSQSWPEPQEGQLGYPNQGEDSILVERVQDLDGGELTRRLLIRENQGEWELSFEQRDGTQTLGSAPGQWFDGSPLSVSVQIPQLTVKADGAQEGAKRSYEIEFAPAASLSLPEAYQLWGDLLVASFTDQDWLENWETLSPEEQALWGSLYAREETEAGELWNLTAPAPAADLELLLYSQVQHNLVSLDYTAALQGEEKLYLLDSQAEVTPEELEELMHQGHYQVKNYTLTLSHDSQQSFEVKKRDVAGAVQVWERGLVQKNGPVSYILLETLEDGLVTQHPLYLHDFNSAGDTGSYSWIGEIETLQNQYTPPGVPDDKKKELETASILAAFNGGGSQWYYGEWKGNQDYSEAQILTQLSVEASITARFRVNQEPLTNSESQSLLNSRRVWSMNYQESLPGWRGQITTTSETQYIDGQGLQTTTKNESTVLGSQLVKTYRVGGNDGYKNVNVSLGQNIRSSQGESQSYSLSASVFGSLSYSLSRSWGSSELMDLNGDRYPELISYDGNRTYVQRNRGDGSFENREEWTGGGFREFENRGASFGRSLAGGSIPISMKISSSGSGGTVEPRPEASGSKASITGSLGFSMNWGASYKLKDLMDLNGDGLPDKVTATTSGFQSQVGTGNLQDPFAAGQTFNKSTGTNQDLRDIIGLRMDNLDLATDIYNTLALANKNDNLLSFTGSSAMSFTGSLGGGITSPGIGVSLSVSDTISVSTNRSYFEMMDLNGDGLPDMLLRDDSGQGIKVRFNTGDSFTPPRLWGNLTPPQILQLDANVTVEDSVNQTPKGHNFDEGNLRGNESPLRIGYEISASTTFSWNLAGSGNLEIDFPVWPVYPFIGIGLTIGGGNSSTALKVGLIDVNGDGLPDQVYQFYDTMLVRLNQTGKVSLLKRVFTPQGGSLTVDYSPSKPTQDDPNSRWVMSTLERNDNQTRTLEGVVQTAAPSLPVRTYRTQFTYEGGKYSRTYREFWGYGEVTTIQKGDASTGDKKTVSLYHNTTVWNKGTPDQSYQYAPSGEILSYQKTYYEVSTPPSYPTSTRWVKTTSTKTETHQDGRVQVSETDFPSYDAYGNPQEVRNYEDGRLKTKILIEYLPVTAHGQASLPVLLEVLDSQNTLLRRRSAQYDSWGSLASHRTYTDPYQYLTSSFTYNDYGNLTRTQDDAGYRVDYTYETTAHQFITQIQDSLGLTSSSQWDYRFALELQQTDSNNQTMTQTYDSFGRLVQVRSPYDSQDGTPAVAFEYPTLTTTTNPEYPLKARTWNKVSYNPSDEQTIQTILILDGLGRSAQMKKESEKWNGVEKVHGWTLSPWTEYDALGRESRTGAPGFDEEIDNLDLAASQVENLTLATTKEYDSRDRIVKTTLPDGSISTQDYRLNYQDQKHTWTITATDPEGRQSLSTLDIDGNILTIVQDPEGQNLTSTFTYDALGQMLSATDPAGHPTTVTYDLAGRRTSLNNKDAGLTTWEYDTKGDMVKKVDPNLRAVNKFIQYTYHQHRLVETTYPGLVKTLYTYGTDPSQNNQGRLIQVQTPRVTTSTTYGKLGETQTLTRLIKTRLAARSDQTYTLGYTWNYLGQNESITYPNGEVVSYGYDKGGQVTSVTGNRLSTDFAYVDDIGYDEYGQRVYLEAGNGTKTTYTYSPTRRWLESLQIQGPQGELQNLSYQFDKTGNVLSLTDTTGTRRIQQNYTYDGLQQLTGATGTFRDDKNPYLVKTAVYHQTLAYDIIGNITQKTSTSSQYPDTTTATALNYSLNYQYDNERPHRAIHVGQTHYVYDLNGNLTAQVPDGEWGQYGTLAQEVNFTNQDGIDVGDRAIGQYRGVRNQVTSGSRQLKWDWENRLIAVRQGSMLAHYDYDEGGERRLKTIGNAEIYYADRLFEEDKTSPVQTLNRVQIYLGDTRIVTKISPKDSGTGAEQEDIYTYHPDHLGSTSLVTNVHGQVFEKVAYTPHGELFVNDSADSLDKVSLLFTGKERDSETGWYYFGARYLDPRTGIWLSSDPALGEYIPGLDKEANKNLPGMGGVFNPVNMAVYHFAGNNPVRYFDPNGREDYDPYTQQYESNKKSGALIGKSIAEALARPFIDPKGENTESWIFATGNDPKSFTGSVTIGDFLNGYAGGGTSVLSGKGVIAKNGKTVATFDFTTTSEGFTSNFGFDIGQAITVIPGADISDVEGKSETVAAGGSKFFIGFTAGVTTTSTGKSGLMYEYSVSISKKAFSMSSTSDVTVVSNVEK